jgi:hypothetical protein
MARLDKIVDFYFTDSGDFCLDTNGDIKTTKNILYRGLLQRVLTRLQSQKGEWATQRTIGANIGNFLGKPNTRAVATKIQNTIVAELSRDDLLRSSEYVVDIFPVSSSKIVIVIVISPARSSGELALTLTYDLRTNRLIPRNV